MRLWITVVALLLALCLCDDYGEVQVGGVGSGDMIALESVTSLQFSASKMARSRSGKRYPQLDCYSGSAKGFAWHPDWYPRVVTCVRFGMGPNRRPRGAEWRCTADLRKFLMLGDTKVLCEQYEDDPKYILDGSCRLQYALNFTTFELHAMHMVYGCVLATLLMFLYALVRYRSMTNFSKFTNKF